MPSTSPNISSIRKVSLRGVWLATAAADPPSARAAAPTRSSLRIRSLSIGSALGSGRPGRRGRRKRRARQFGRYNQRPRRFERNFARLAPLLEPRRRIDGPFLAAQFEIGLAVLVGAAQGLAVADALARLDLQTVQARDHGAPAGAEVQDHHLAPLLQRPGVGD